MKYLPFKAAASAFPRRWVVPLIVALAFFMEQFDNAALAVSMPAIAAELRIEPLRLSLLITAYVLSVVLFMPTSGWLANRYGARRVFAIALGIYAAGSAGCGLAGDLTTLIGFRVVQGLGGALMTPVGRLILLRNFARHELIAAMGLMTAPVLFGPLLGPLLGGLITAYGSWRAIFLINLPVAALGLVMTFRHVPHDGILQRTRFDLRGFLLLSPCLVLFQIAIEALDAPSAPWPLLGAGVILAFILLAAYWRHAREGAARLLDVSLFLIRSFRVGSLAGGLSRLGFNAAPFLLPLYLQLVLGYETSLSGLLVATAIIGALAAKPFNGRLVRLVGFRGTLIGSAVLGSALIMALALQGASVPPAVLACHIFAIGAAQTIQYNTLNILTYAEVAPERQSAASSLGGIVQQLAMGLAVSWSATALSLIGGAGRLDHGDFAVVFLLAGLLPLLATIGFARMRRDEGKHVMSQQG